MKRNQASRSLILAALILGFAALACGQFAPAQPTPTPAPQWTPPSEIAPAPTPGTAIGGSDQGTTADPHLVVITENDIANAIAGGPAEQQGIHVDNLKVRFAGGKTQITADQVSYGMISIQNLVITGRLVAQDGTLQLETESVSPQGLVSGMIPGLINQALKQYASQWYVEDVRTLDGRIEVRIR